MMSSACLKGAFIKTKLRKVCTMENNAENTGHGPAAGKCFS
jgi:hypothetical protein